MIKKNIGSSFEDFLKGEDTLEATTEQAVKRALALQLAEVMKEQVISKVEMAKRLDTSRSQLDCILDPENDGVTLDVLAQAASVVGRSLKLELV